MMAATAIISAMPTTCRHKWLVSRADRVPVGTPLVAVCQRCGTTRTYPKELPTEDSWAPVRRRMRGSANPASKLSEADIRQILGSPLASRPLAARFKVSRRIIGGVRAGRMWRHVRRPAGYHYSPPSPEPRRGEANPASKLTAAAVRQIRAAESGFGELARRYQVSRSTIYRVRTGALWGAV